MSSLESLGPLHRQLPERFHAQSHPWNQGEREGVQAPGGPDAINEDKSLTARYLKEKTAWNLEAIPTADGDRPGGSEIAWL